MYLKRRSLINKLLLGNTLSIMSNYVIPSEVAPQQSFSPLYVTVNTKMKNIIN
jgi:hypothetical protein